MSFWTEARRFFGRRHRDRSIFAKVLTGVIAITLLILLMSGTFSYLLLRQYRINAKMSELLDKAAAIAEDIAQSGECCDGLTFSELHNYERLASAQVVCVDAHMHALHARSYLPGGAPEDAVAESVLTAASEQALIQRILDGRPTCGVSRSESLGSRVMYAGAPILDAERGVVGALILYRYFAEIVGVDHSLALMMAISVLIAILLVMGFALMFSSRLTQPLSQLNATAKRMANGYYGERVVLPQRDEIGQLGDTLNLLSSRLSATIERLSDEKGRLGQILDGIGEGLVAIDRDGMTVLSNPAALKLLEISAWQPEHGREYAPHQWALLRMLIKAMDSAERARATWKPDPERTIEAVVWPVFNAEAEIIGAVALLRDITEAERLEQMRRDYVANISHELRTPLTGIRGMVEPLMDGYIETDAERMECYQIIYQETMRLEKLIGEMLDLSRLQAGHSRLELEPMMIAGLLVAAERRVRERAALGGVSIAIRDEAREAVVMGDENRILQVLIILLDNALSFTPAGGSVTIFTRPAGEYVVVGVRDSGVGIEPEDLPYIWERFYKADKARMGTAGTGLGLAIARRVVELMGGTIEARSEPGKGAQFEFTLRVAERQA